MINQKLISFKINDTLLPALDSLCVEYDIKRNKMLNALVSVGIAQMSGKSSMFYILMILSNVSFDD